MRFFVVVVLLLELAGCSGATPKPEITSRSPDEPSSSPTGTARGRTLPDLVLPKLGGGTPMRLSEASGRPTVINAWATWCAPCRKELPFFGRASREYADRVSFLGVNVADPDSRAALAMAKETGASFPHVVDLESKTRVPLGYTGGLPTTVFVDAQGRIVGEERTWFRSYADLTAAISRHLGVAP